MTNDSQPCAGLINRRWEIFIVKLLQVARRMSHVDDATAQDLVNEAIRKALRAKPRDWLENGDESEVLPYLRRALTNGHCDFIKKLRHTSTAGNEKLEQGTSLSGALQRWNYDERRLMDAITEAIPDPQRREIFVGQHLLGKTDESIAEGLGIARTTVWRRTRSPGQTDPECMERIRRILERDGCAYEAFFF